MHEFLKGGALSIDRLIEGRAQNQYVLIKYSVFFEAIFLMLYHF